MFFSPQSTQQPAATGVSGDSDALGDVSYLDQLAYCGIAMPGVMSLGFADWVAQSNAQSDLPRISGMLMWEGRLLIHWLEGPASDIDLLWEKTQNDVGQHCLVLLLRRSGVTQRLFDSWQMHAASRNEMMAIVREAKEQANLVSPQDTAWQYAISTLSILLDPDLTACYAQKTQSTVMLTNLQQQALIA
jgi:Sensors of blue-light using FAD